MIVSHSSTFNRSSYQFVSLHREFQKEENLLCLDGDVYAGFNVGIHELTHSLLGHALSTCRYMTKGDTCSETTNAYAEKLYQVRRCFTKDRSIFTCLFLLKRLCFYPIRSETWWKRDCGPTRTQQQTIGNISPRE